MSDRVRKQEQARGWHRLSDAQQAVVARLTAKAKPSMRRKAQPQIIEDDMVPPGTMYALNFNSMKIVREAREYEHDRRLRGQYE